MTKRFAHLHKLAQIRRDIQAFPADSDTILRTAILRALPLNHANVYYMVCHLEHVTSADVVREYHWSQNQAADTLAELWQWGLLERAENLDGTRRYIYSVEREFIVKD